jgi:hypothetical protein
MNGADNWKRAEERRATFARIAHHLNEAHKHLQVANSLNHQFGLELDLPREQPLADAITAAAHKLKGEQPQ